MHFNCIVTQVHIPHGIDVQGNLNPNQKKKLVSTGIAHLRKYNEDAYIILSGHGERPNNLDLCDKVFWNDKCEPLDGNGYVVGQPAQFKYVHQGIDYATKLGFTRLLKTRGDCILGIPNMTDYCQSILEQENKALLITQQTGSGYRLGDCLMFGVSRVLHDIWDAKNDILNLDGLINTGLNLYKKYANGQFITWDAFVKQTCSFRDVNKLKFIDLRWNFHFLCAKYGSWEKAEDVILANELDAEKYHWGRITGWHGFDTEGNMVTSCNDNFWSEKQFYAN